MGCRLHTVARAHRVTCANAHALLDKITVAELAVSGHQQSRQALVQSHEQLRLTHGRFQSAGDDREPPG